MQRRFGPTIFTLYVSHFLIGLVFWYGIEKLFMRHIGINGFGIGIAAAAQGGITLLSDVPLGMLADKWSRKGVIIIAVASLAVCSLILSASTNLLTYLFGYIFYCIYLVATSGTYQALIYDVLHERQQTAAYSKVMGKAYALFLAGAGVANIASGFIAQKSLTLPFVVTIIPCALNIALLLTVREPQFHKKEQKEKMLRQLATTAKTMWRTLLVRSLVLMWMTLAVSELFKLDFSQLFMLQFTNSAIVLGLLWAGYAFAWALGAFFAHRLKNYLHVVMVASLALLILLALPIGAWGLVVFMAQVVAGGAVSNLIETHVQDNTPSGLRASVMSLLTTSSRLVNLPLGIIFGVLISRSSILSVVWVVAGVAAVGLVYWVIVGQRRVPERRLAHVAQEPAPPLL